MPSAADEFIREIAEHPEDDEPRLVFADWLEERGSSQGEFIRLQCELETLEIRDPRRSELESRELQLVRQHSKGWAGPLRRFAKRWRFRRGLVDSVRIDTRTFLNDHDEIFAVAPIQEVDFADPYEHLLELAECESLSRLRGLGLTHGHIGRDGDPRGSTLAWEGNDYRQYNAFQQRVENSQQQRRQNGLTKLSKLLDSPHLDQLRRLNLDHNNLADAGAAIVAGSVNLSMLEQLSLRGSQFEADGCTILRESPHLQNLRRLAFGSCFNIRHNYAEEWVGPFCEAVKPFIPRLESLEVAMCGLTLHSIESFADCSCEALRRLSIASSMLTEHSYLDDPPTFQVLAESPLLRNLDELDLSSCYLDADTLRTVDKGGSLTRIVKLALNNDAFGPAGGEALSELRFPDLTHLDLGGANENLSYVDSQMKDSAAKIFHSSHLGNLASLKLSKQGLTDAGIESIADSAILRQLYHLDLSNNMIGDAGVDRLASLRPWPRLALLNLRGNKFGKASRDRLIQTYGYRVIV